MSVEIVQGDLEPDIQFTCSVNGTAEDISDSTARVLRWKKPGEETTVDVALTTVSLAAGTVKRVWAAGDTDIAGAHRGRVVVTRANGETQTFPSDGSWFIWFVNASE
jgi:hypothetical protein